MIDTLNTIVATVVGTFALMIFLQWQDRKNIRAKEKERHAKHLCTQLYDANLTSAKDSELINQELFRQKDSNRNSAMFQLYHNNMVHVEWDRSQLERMAPKIKQLTAQLRKNDLKENFYDAYGQILLDEIQDDQLKGWSAQDQQFVQNLRQKTTRII
jgi:hypothetical protein